MGIELQRLTDQNLEMMEQLLTCFQHAFEDPEEYGQNRPSDQYLRTLLSSDQFIALVALKNSKVIGGLVAYELKKFEQHRSEIYIYDLAVCEDYRRQGIATSLIEYLKPIAREARAWVIYVQADRGDEAPIALYNKLGLQEEVLHFDIPVS